MRSIWAVLGLSEPTNDLRAIKSAYAAKLKTVRPNEDQAGFMELRQAFESAKNYAKYDFDDFDDEITTTSYIESDGDNTPIEVVSFSEETPAPSEPDDSFRNDLTDRITDILQNPWKAGSKDCWETLFEDHGQGSIDVEADFKDILQHVLLEHFGFYSDGTESFNRNRKPRVISSEIGTYIFDKMNWHEATIDNRYEQYQIDFLRKDFDVFNRDKNVSLEDVIAAGNQEPESSGWETGCWIIFAIWMIAKVAQVLIEG